MVCALNRPKHRIINEPFLFFLRGAIEKQNLKIMEIYNCVVCEKYLKDIGEQESGMCNKCDNITSKISKEQLKNNHNV